VLVAGPARCCPRLAISLKSFLFTLAIFCGGYVSNTLLDEVVRTSTYKTDSNGYIICNTEKPKKTNLRPLINGAVEYAVRAVGNNSTADKAYDSQRARQQIKDEGALPIIPSRSNATRKAYCPKRFYRQRHKIENFFCRIKDWRRIATRYDKLARNFLAATTLVGVLYWIKL
jgi:transposase